MERLPDEVMVQILSYLEVEELCQVALVCRGWCYLANDNSLWRKIVPMSNTTDTILYKLIDRHPYITHFQYKNSKITETGLSRLCVQCGPTLTHLDLDSCYELTSELLSVIVEYCVSLTHLDISANPCVDDVTMCQLAACQNLTSLKIRNCDRVTDGGLEMLLVQRPLQELDASYLLDIRLRTVENLVNFSSTTLQRLLLDGGNLGDEAVAKIGQLPQLRLLELQYCDEITDTGLTPLAQLSSLTSLRLYRCFNLTSSGITELVSQLGSLRVLVLSDCSEIDDIGLVSIGRHCKRLERLELTQSYCHTLTDVGLSAVLLGCPRLYALVLKGLKGIRTFVTLIPILKERRLCHVHLGGCQNIPTILLETVAAFCPDLKIYGHYANEVKQSELVLNAFQTDGE